MKLNDYPAEDGDYWCLDRGSRPSPSPSASPSPSVSPSPSSTPSPSPSPSPSVNPSTTPIISSSPTPCIACGSDNTNTNTNTNTNENTQEQTQNNNQTVNITQNITATSEGQVLGASVPTKQPETGVGVLGMATIFSAAPLGLVLSRFGKRQTSTQDKKEGLASFASFLVEGRKRRIN